jgi:Late embryogenesis abundant protein
MKKTVITLMLLIGILSLIALPCLAAEEKAAAPDKPAMGKKMAPKMTAPKAPVVKLDRVEIANYWGYYLDGILDKEGKLTAGRRGAPMVLSFVYTIQNPNNHNVMLDNMKFTVAFEGFELNTLTNFDNSYIPPKKTNTLRVNGTFDYNTANLSLLVTSGHRLQEMNVKSGDLLKKWWEGISDFTFPITVNGTATFVGPDGKNIIVPFEGTFPEKK